MVYYSLANPRTVTLSLETIKMIKTLYFFFIPTAWALWFMSLCPNGCNCAHFVDGSLANLWVNHLNMASYIINKEDTFLNFLGVFNFLSLFPPLSLMSSFGNWRGLTIMNHDRSGLKYFVMQFLCSILIFICFPCTFRNLMIFSI